MKAFVAVAALWVAAGAVAATEADDRARINQQRSAAQARFDLQVAHCQQNFAVTACVDVARAERRERIDALTAQERVLDDAARKRRAAERIAEIEARQKTPLQPLESERKVTTRQGDAASAPRPLETPHPSALHKAPSVHPEQRRELEAKKRAAFETRQQAAEAHRKASEEHRSKVTANKPALAIAPLPAPLPAASAPSAQRLDPDQRQ